MIVAEADEGKLTTIDIIANPEISNNPKFSRDDSNQSFVNLNHTFRFRDQMRLGKLKTLLKGIEDTRISQVIQMRDYQALELNQQNCQTFIVFMDKETGDLKASFQYQREIKSGFVYLCD